MFGEKIPSLNENKKLLRSWIDTRYAQINWKFHLKPLVKEAYLEFHGRLSGKGYETPFFTCLSDSLEYGEEINVEKDVYGDSISIQYGAHPVSVRPILRKDKVTRVLVEEGATLVFSMGINGGVIASICPQKSDVSRTKQKYYLIGEWRNAAQITKSDIKNMLEFLFEVQTYCGIYYAGKLSARILSKLHAKDASIREGSNPLIRYVKYLVHLINGIRKVYGVGSPTP